MENTYEAYKNHLQKIGHLGSVMSLMGWDQEVHMPKKGAGIRAQQFSTLSALAHEMSTDPAFENVVDHLLKNGSFGFKERRNLEETKKDIEKSKKLPAEFIQKNAIAVSKAFQAWEKARAEESFEVFLPTLQEIVDLAKEKSDLLGFEDHPYDALLDIYESGLTVSTLEKVFAQVKAEIVPLVKQIAEKEQVKGDCLFQKFDKDEQWEFSLELLKEMNYDFDAGRQDLSTHPFTTGFHSNDVRVTTRVTENDLGEIIWSTIHEGGHGLYEQGLNPDHFGLPSGNNVGLGIHESQSRIWENNIGRALPWWEHLYPSLQKRFPDQLADVTLDEFYKAMNLVKPSLIRTSADELTYHVHVMIRYEIEKGLIEGEIAVADLEEVWNQKYTDYLGVTPSKPSEGVLQDIHWSHGSIGYFPTYSIGSFYAAQFYAESKKRIPALEDQLRKGNTSEFLKLMRKNIHQHGRLYPAEQLSENFTGEKLNIDYFVKYAKEKYSRIYGL